MFTVQRFTGSQVVYYCSLRIAYCQLPICYSVLKLFTGFALAAFTACRLSVTKATIAVTAPAKINIHHGIPILKTKSCNHLCKPHQAMGKATNAAIAMSFKKSIDNMPTILLTDAPSTFLIPISFVRFTTIKVANPNNPMQAIKMDKTEA